VSNRTHRSFTLRVEIPFYLELAEKAQAEGIPLNQLANRLLRLGMDKHISLDSALRALLLDKIVQEDPAVQA
jgi:predicted DNA-binding ribbon-helix-helix protein